MFYFRWRKPTASLKFEEQQDAIELLRYFRWRKPTASLKSAVRIRRRALRSRFPLAKADGLIEVEHGVWMSKNGWSFPLAKADGLIEVRLSTRAW